MFTFPTVEEIQAYKKENDCSLTEASQTCFQRQLLYAIAEAQDVEGLRDILLFMVSSPKLYMGS